MLLQKHNMSSNAFKTLLSEDAINYINLRASQQIFSGTGAMENVYYYYIFYWHLECKYVYLSLLWWTVIWFFFFLNLYSV